MDKGVFVAILTVGTGPPKGVPRPVENRTIWQPVEANAVVDTRSFPGPFNKFSPFSNLRSP